MIDLRTTTPFIVSFKSNENTKIRTTYDEICKIWENAGWKGATPARFNEITNQIELNLTPRQMEALGHMHHVFNKIIFFKEHYSIFRGYCTKYDTNYKPVDLEKFNREARQSLKNASLNHVQIEIPDTERSLHTTVSHWLTSEGFSGVVMGESHFECGLKSFLIENMPLLGINTIFLEFLGQEEQEVLDLYLKSDLKNLPPEVLAIINWQDNHYKHPVGSRLIDVVQAAKKNGIRVVGIESEASKTIDDDPRMGQVNSSRTLALNYSATQIINREKENGKYVVLVGNTHVSTYRNVPGLSQLLGVPGLLLFDHSICGSSEVRDGFNIQIPVKGLTGIHHAVFILGKEIDLNPAPPQKMSLYATNDAALHKRMDRNVTVFRLSDEEPGSWLIREGTTTPGTFVLALKNDDGQITQQVLSNKKQLKSKIQNLKLDHKLQILP